MKVMKNKNEIMARNHALHLGAPRLGRPMSVLSLRTVLKPWT